MSLKATIQADMKTALKGGEKERLSVIRMLLAAIQSSEIEVRGAAQRCRCHADR